MHRSVDRVKIIALVDSYFLDVIRFKEYHFNPKNHSELDVNSTAWLEAVHVEKNINPAKIASFTAKWLLNYKPIILEPIGDENLSLEDIELINSAPAILALNFSLYLISLSQQAINERLAKAIIYHFRYRTFDERAFFL